MFTIPTTLTITDLRRKSAKIMKKLPEEKLFLLVQNSRARGALVDLKYFKKLQDAYEEYMDILTYDKAIKEPTISWEEYKKRR